MKKLLVILSVLALFVSTASLTFAANKPSKIMGKITEIKADEKNITNKIMVETKKEGIKEIDVTAIDADTLSKLKVNDIVLITLKAGEENKADKIEIKPAHKGTKKNK